MPAMLEDALALPVPSPTSLPSLYHNNVNNHLNNSENVSPSASASASASVPGSPSLSPPQSTSLPASITPRSVTLRDRITSATLLPFFSSSEIPPGLLARLCAQFNLEIEKGDTYPLLDPLTIPAFGAYWFQNFGAIMFLGDIVGGKDHLWALEEAGEDWQGLCLGTFYIKPNYPGRSSHICNGGFIVTNAARNKGVGRLMGEAYLAWAPKLNYVYSVFNLVYETNVASIRIWEALGFKRIGRVKGAGNLRSSPHELVDAIIYGRDLGPEGADFVSDERFEKIRFYLKHGKYPNGADRAEKSRLRSAATHYKLLPAEDQDERASGRDTDRLMLKDKEVVADAQRQYEIARRVHANQHAGINKTTAVITEKYHWVRIKETVSLVIKNCPDCKDPSKPPTVRPAGDGGSRSSSGALTVPGSGTGGGSLGSNGHGRRLANGSTAGAIDPNSMIERMVNFDDLRNASGIESGGGGGGGGRADSRFHSRRREGAAGHAIQAQDIRTLGLDYNGLQQPAPVASMGGGLQPYPEIPVDPRIMQLQPPSQPHSHPPMRDLLNTGLGNRSGEMRPRTFPPASALPAHMNPPMTHDPTPSGLYTTPTLISSSPMSIYHQQHQQQYINPDGDGEDDEDEDADFEPDMSPGLHLTPQPPQHQRMQEIHQQHAPEDETMGYDPTLDAEGDEEQGEGALDVDGDLNLHGHDNGMGNGHGHGHGQGGLNLRLP